MKLFLSIVGIMAALIMAAVSASINYVFLASLGKTAIEGQILGAASAAADLLKCLLPFFIAWSWRARRYAAALAGACVFILFAAFSLLSAIGFAADNRGVMTESRADLDQSYARQSAQRDELQARLSALPSHRPQGVTAEELRAAEQDRLWARSKNCVEATENASRAFCVGYFQLRSELASAEEAQRLRAAMDAHQADLVRMKMKGAGQERDPQVAILARLFALSRDHVRLTLIVAVALIVELGSSLGLYLASGHGGGGVRPTETQSIQAPPLEITARKMGDIEDFVLEELVPVPGAGISLVALQTAYAAWCERCQLEAMAPEVFAEQWDALAQTVNLPQIKGQYRGIALKQGMALAA